MKNEKSKQETILSVNEKSFALIADIVAQEEEKDALQTMAFAQEDGKLSAEEAIFMDRMDAHFMREVYDYFHKQRRRHFFSRTLPRIVQTAAAVIAVFAVAGTVAIAASQSVRITVMKLLYKIQPEYTIVTMQEDMDASFNVPGEWMEDYYPSYVPDELHIVQLVSDDAGSVVEWADAQAYIRLHLSVLKEDSLMHVDTEDADIEYFNSGNKKDGMLVMKGDVINVVWCTYDRYFLLYMNGYDRTAAMRMVESIQRIK